MANKRKTLPIGSFFGEWEIIAPAPNGTRGATQYLLRCKCGIERVTGAHRLRTGETMRCRSCSNKEYGAVTHGENRRGQITVEYVAWCSMIRRCQRADYASNGTRVDSQWLGSNGFKNFLKHVGRRPSQNHSLDRKNNDGHYEPGNVRWATRIVQQGNRTCTRRITAFGTTKSLQEWATTSPITPEGIWYRLRHGWKPEDAITQKGYFKESDKSRMTTSVPPR